MIPKRMKRLDLKTYEAMIEGARMLTNDPHGPKVFALKNGLILKLFRLKRPVSSALLRPYATRFTSAAERLPRLGIPTVSIEATYKVKELKRDVVLYHPLAGETLRDTLAASENPGEILARFAPFLAKLHELGIYFRSVHFGNVLVMEDGEFGLIDIHEARFSRGPLSLSKRIRNFKPIFHYREDREAIRDFGVEKFAERYLAATSIRQTAHAAFTQWLKGTHLSRKR